MRLNGVLGIPVMMSAELSQLKAVILLSTTMGGDYLHHFSIWTILFLAVHFC